MRAIAADEALNPWRRPVQRALRAGAHEALRHLNGCSIVPRQNWIEILAFAPTSVVLFDTCVPRLAAADWADAFARRFLPACRRWKRDASWKEAYLRFWHRALSSCSADEAWTRYIVLNRNSSACELQATSRNFNPFLIFNEIKQQANFTHLETRVRVVLELTDVRILAFGTLSKKSPLSHNPIAHALLHPPGIEKDSNPIPTPYLVHDHGVYPMKPQPVNHADYNYTYTRLRYPTPNWKYANYPFYTPGGSDRRWNGSGEAEEGGLQWVGGMIIVTQFLSPSQQYASFSWADLWAIAPWLEDRITKRIDGPGIGV
ncbi:hypothetical protein AX14_012124 [Amanita brunnescens Koide BX004]|nr:hypothetical protein AX14_012124 [Amanita brunnescens Koide BX004]